MVTLTYTLLDVLALVILPVQVIIEHVLKVGLVALVAGPLVVDCVGEQGIEAEADEVGFADLA